MNNLISNAVKFTKAGGTVNIIAFQHKIGVKLSDEFRDLGEDISVRLPDDDFKDSPISLVVAVSDNGIGIPKDGISQLFNKFKQLGGSLAVTKKGTGLGLAIAKGIVEGHGGKIGAVSEEGVGSTFYFMLPLAGNGVQNIQNTK